MAKSPLEVIQAWGSRCSVCGELATNRKAFPLVIPTWVFTNGTLIRTMMVTSSGPADPIPDVTFLDDLAYDWAVELNLAGFPSEVTYQQGAQVRHSYLCEVHVQPGSEPLQYRDLLLGVIPRRTLLGLKGC